MPRPKFPWKLGEWRAQCDRCGFHYHNVHLRKEWTGLRVCHGPNTNNCFEMRNAQEFVRGVRDKQSPPWSRPKPDSIFSTAIITGATQANPVVITAVNSFANAKTVWIRNVNGMTQINNLQFTTANVTSTTFELSGVNGTGYTAFSADDTDNTSADQQAMASVDVAGGDL